MNDDLTGRSEIDRLLAGTEMDHQPFTRRHQTLETLAVLMPIDERLYAQKRFGQRSRVIKFEGTARPVCQHERVLVSAASVVQRRKPTLQISDSKGP